LRPIRVAPSTARVEIDKGARSRWQSCLGNPPAIEQWRQNIGLTQRLRLNHPTVVWSRLEGYAENFREPGQVSRIWALLLAKLSKSCIEAH
jgi:hypothetical protein